ncbi:hypothetical protein [Halorhabdus amylolytica]|uniref:hypothetical protein n=1 Tax=Halorhabdus amylolytica TaxID=2559573 RepID=UPI0010A996EC|nr:hypothetical protein [Halorhabdus amylolytica]
MSGNTDVVGDKERLLLGAGFAFGVMLTLVVLELVLVMNGTVPPGDLFTSPDALTVIAGIVFAGVVGIALFVLSFPGNRSRIPIAADDEK